MNKKILLFGFEQLPEILAIAKTAESFGAEVVPVHREDYQKPLGALAGLKHVSGSALPSSGGALGGRMMLLCGLEDQLDGLLPALQAAGVDRTCLKAVLTEHNRSWNARYLFSQLCEERKALEKR